MIKILFVCHGNICRSPMAEFIMKKLVKDAGLTDRFEIASAATSSEEIWNGVGNPVYPPARKIMEKHGLNCDGKQAVQMTKADYDHYDYLIGMDKANIRNMSWICGGDPDGKFSMMMDYTARPGAVADPWYTGDFTSTWEDLWEGCHGLLDFLTREEPELKEDPEKGNYAGDYSPRYQKPYDIYEKARAQSKKMKRAHKGKNK